MSERRYRMTKRLESTERTRATIIDAARELLAEGGPEEFSVQRIADRAGVTRPTIYARFGSRREFLETLVADAEQRVGVAAAIAASEAPDPVDAMVDWLQAAVAFWASEHAVLGSAYALSRTDPDLSGVLAAHDEARHRRAKRLARRLASAGRLRKGYSTVQAADTLWLISGFAVYQELSRNGHTPAAITRTVVQLARTAIVAP
jgi:AcrR family transcriptional regulator